MDLVTDSLSRKLSPYLRTASIKILLASPSQGVSGNGFTHRELGQLPDLLISPLLFGSGNGISREAGWISGTMDLLPSLLWQRSHSREGCPSSLYKQKQKLLKATTWNISLAVLLTLSRFSATGQVPLARKLGKSACCMRKPKLHYPRRPLAGKYDLGRTRRQWRRNIKAEVFSSVST